MSNLYNQLAAVYEAMYKSFISYADEFELYKSLVEPHLTKKTIVEIGCGTGNLANYFSDAGYDYTGLDVSTQMLQIAQLKAPNCNFLEADMRQFSLKQAVNCIIITARTISYLITNDDVNNALETINKNLLPNGILCFDFIDANKYISQLAANNKPIHKATSMGITYVRKGHWQNRFTHGLDFYWTANYYKQNNNELKLLGTDEAMVRAFTKNEIENWLAINGFECLKFIERATYAFPTFVVVAKKR